MSTIQVRLAAMSSVSREVDRIQAKLGEGSDSLSTCYSRDDVTAVMTRCKTVSADGSRWGKRSGRVAFLSLQIQKTERRDGERVADKLCSLGNDWMRSKSGAGRGIAGAVI